MIDRVNRYVSIPGMIKIGEKNFINLVPLFHFLSYYYSENEKSLIQ